MERGGRNSKSNNIHVLFQTHLSKHDYQGGMDIDHKLGTLTVRSSPPTPHAHSPLPSPARCCVESAAGGPPPGRSLPSRQEDRLLCRIGPPGRSLPHSSIVNLLSTGHGHGHGHVRIAKQSEAQRSTARSICCIHRQGGGAAFGVLLCFFRRGGGVCAHRCAPPRGAAHMPPCRPGGSHLFSRLGCAQCGGGNMRARLRPAHGCPGPASTAASLVVCVRLPLS